MYHENKMQEMPQSSDKAGELSFWTKIKEKSNLFLQEMSSFKCGGIERGLMWTS
jgi:hypothetical protein